MVNDIKDMKTRDRNVALDVSTENIPNIQKHNTQCRVRWSSIEMYVWLQSVLDVCYRHSSCEDIVLTATCCIYYLLRPDDNTVPPTPRTLQRTVVLLVESLEKFCRVPQVCAQCCSQYLLFRNLNILVFYVKSTGVYIFRSFETWFFHFVKQLQRSAYNGRIFTRNTSR